MAYGRISIAGSLIGGIKATQDCIDFCAEKKIYPQTEIVTATKLGSIYEQLNKGNDSITRYVLDIEKSVKEAK